MVFTSAGYSLLLTPAPALFGPAAEKLHAAKPFHPCAGTGPSTCTAGENTQDNDSLLFHLNSASLFREQPRSNTAFSGNRHVAEPRG